MTANTLLKTFWLILITVAAGFGIWWANKPNQVDSGLPLIKKLKADQIPSDWFWQQRAYPVGEINYAAFETAKEQSVRLKKRMKKTMPQWQSLGPTLVGGRMTDVEILPDGTWLAGSASGGIFRSTNTGVTWTPIFEEAFSLSIGDIAIAPSNPDRIYVGTGEANGGGGSATYAGVGVYRSDDGGESWQRAGLPYSRFIGRMQVHPQNADLVYAAVLGRQFGFNEERGLYRSRDGGITWEKVLSISEKTGCVDVAIDPNRPNRLFAAMWQRRRTESSLFYGGAESGLYFSDDGGDTWKELQGGLPKGELGRIGIAISRSNSDIVYAIYAEASGAFAGVYKSTDGGENWLRTNDAETAPSYRTACSWFGQVRVDPTNPDYVFALGVLLHFSTDGGNTWQEYRSYAMDNNLNFNVHVDHHGLVFDLANPNTILLANDGGIYRSSSQQLEFLERNNFSNIQFYTCEIDPRRPSRVYGGTQDNGTWGSLSGDPQSWDFYLGGDGFQVEVDPTNSRSIYFEYQYGNLFHFLNGQYFEGMGHLEDSDRANWNAPILIDPNDSRIVYHASQRVFRTNTGVANFTPISGDLTKGDPGGNRVFGSLTAIAVAQGNSNVIYVGADDGNVQMTMDGGETWHNRSSGLPLRWVRAIAVHPQDPMTAYAAFSGFRHGEYQPHLLKTTNGGVDWDDISTRLPEAPINDVILDPDSPQRMYVASDVGVFFSMNDGADWEVLGRGMPAAVVNDLDLHAGSNTLVAATYGRGMFRLDLSEIVDDNEVSGSQLLHRYVLSELRGSLDGTTYLGIVNSGDELIDLEVFAFDSSGVVLEKASIDGVLNARQKLWLRLEEALPQSADTAAWLQVGASAPLVAFAEIGNLESRGAFLAKKAEAGTVFLPHIAADTRQFQTYLSSVNPHATGLQSEIQVGQTGLVQPIPEHFASFAKMSRDVRDYFGQDLTSVSFAGVHDSLRGSVSTGFYHRLPNRSQMAVLGLSREQGSTLRFLHVAEDTTNFWTGMVYINTGTEPARTEELYFDSDGQLLETRVREAVAAEEKITLLFDQSNLQNLPTGTAWIEVNADQNLIGYDLFGSGNASQNDFFAGIEGSFASSASLVYPHFLASENQWLGLVAVNTGSIPEDLTLTVYAADGSALASKVLAAVPPRGKQTLLVGDFFDDPDVASKGAWIQAEGETPIWSGFLLWGDRGQTIRQNLSGMVASPRP